MEVNHQDWESETDEQALDERQMLLYSQGVQLN